MIQISNVLQLRPSEQMHFTFFYMIASSPCVDTNGGEMHSHPRQGTPNHTCPASLWAGSDVSFIHRASSIYVKHSVDAKAYHEKECGNQ